MKILIAGDGKLGATLVRQLSTEGYDVTVIDEDPAVLETTMEQYDVITIEGNAATMKTLKQAGVEEADLLIAVTGEDELNLLSCMTAHALNPSLHTIARIRNPEYVDQAYTMRENFALSLIVNPEKQAAHEIERLIKYPGFLKNDTFARGHLEIVELKIGTGSKLRNVPLSALHEIIKCRVLVVAVLREGTMIAPDGSFVLQEGDDIYVTASAADLSALLRNLGILQRRVKHCMIVGGGKVSYYLSQMLVKSGLSVEIIERDAERCIELADAIPEAAVVQGDASTPAFLESEGLSEADSFVTLTGLDELNIILSLYAHSKKVPQVITKLSRVDYSKAIGDLPIGSVISPKELCCSNIVRYVRAMRNQQGAAVTIHSIADGQAEAVEFIVDDKTRHVGEPLKDIRTRNNILIAGISRGYRSMIPDGSSSFEIGDSVVVVCSGDTILYSLNDIFED